jgi:hypothetical protein
MQAGPPSTSGPAAAGGKPPAVIVLKQGADNANGDIFITPSGGSVGGPEIISNTGKVIWFHRLPAHELASDFRTQTYLGKPVLTWWQGPPDLGAVSGGTDYIYNDRYQKIAEVKGGNGHSVDGQEFLITPWNTALIIADTITTANLTSIGGPPRPEGRRQHRAGDRHQHRQGALPVERRGPRPL